MDILDRFKVPAEVQEQRMDMCLQCEHLFRPTKQCKKCGCFMGIKTWVRDLECPIGKWGKHGSGLSWDVDEEQPNDNAWGSYEVDS
jgi:hypothetical protein